MTFSRIRKKLNAHEAAIRGLDSTILRLQRDNNSLVDAIRHIAWMHEKADQHEEDAALYKKLYEEEKEVYALSVAKENALQEQLAQVRKALKILIA